MHCERAKRVENNRRYGHSSYINFINSLLLIAVIDGWLRDPYLPPPPPPPSPPPLPLPICKLNPLSN